MHIQEDLEYWGIDENLMTACCALNHFPELSHSQKESERDKENRLLDARRAIEEDFGHAWYGKIRSFLWTLTEYPERSPAARVRYVLVGYVENSDNTFLRLTTSFHTDK